jgi:4-aminobutyrate aminotransferase-like enzyme
LQGNRRVPAPAIGRLKGKHEIIGDVRGMGLLQPLELVEDRNGKGGL